MTDEVGSQDIGFESDVPRSREGKAFPSYGTEIDEVNQDPPLVEQRMKHPIHGDQSVTSASTLLRRSFGFPNASE